MWVRLTQLTQADTLKVGPWVSPEEAPNTNVICSIAVTFVTPIGVLLDEMQNEIRKLAGDSSATLHPLAMESGPSISTMALGLEDTDASAELARSRHSTNHNYPREKNK